MDRGNCGSCGAEVIWGVTAAQRKMPVDPDPVSGGNVKLTEMGDGPPLVTVLGKGAITEAEIMGEELHTSHMFTCPNAKKHRRR